MTYKRLYSVNLNGLLKRLDYALTNELKYYEIENFINLFRM